MANEFASRARGPLPCAFVCLLLTLLCAGPLRAQEAKTSGEARREPVARKVSWYVNQFSSCNAGAHLDHLTIELRDEPGARAHVIVYGPGGLSESYAARALDATKNYLVTSRGLEESRVVTQYGGVYRSKDELLTELWLVPEGAAPPPLVEYKNDAATFEGKFADFETWDDTFYGFGDVEGWSHEGEVRTIGLADMLRSRSGMRVYVVVFNGKETAPGAWRRIAEREIDVLRRHGVAGERVRVIYGGYREQPMVKLWVLPEKAPPPAKDAGRERRPGRVVQLSTLEQSGLKYKDGARRALKHLADVLRTDDSLTAAVIVHLKAPDETPPLLPDEPPDLDLVRMVERWKGELKRVYGIGEHRLHVTVVPPDEGSWERVETWVVPPGFAPPDPFAAEAVGEKADGPEGGGKPPEF